ECPEPKLRPNGRGDADRPGDRESDAAADERDAQRPPALPGADIGAHHRDQRRAETEHQRDQQVFEPRPGAIARYCVGAGGGSDTRTTTPTLITDAGTSMLPVPRTALASAFIAHSRTLPANTTLE